MVVWRTVCACIYMGRGGYVSVPCVYIDEGTSVCECMGMGNECICGSESMWDMWLVAAHVSGFVDPI